MWDQSQKGKGGIQGRISAEKMLAILQKKHTKRVT